MDDRALQNELLRMQRNLSHSMTEYVQAARSMMYLVRAVDLTFEPLYSGRALQRAIWRYEALWLPLLAALSNPPSSQSKQSASFSPVWCSPAFSTKVDDISAKNFSTGGLWLSTDRLVPPIDIAWVWHCHRLNPHAYNDDLANLVPPNSQQSIDFIRRACATNIHTAFRFSDGEDAQSRPTRRLWDIVYPFEAYMPKYLLSHSFEKDVSNKRQHITSYANEISRASFRSLLTYDLVKAAKLQKAFLYQIVDQSDLDKSERFETNEFLQRAYHRYLQFIVLHQHASDSFLVPMNDINIIWHMHLSCTTEYAHDCHALVGDTVKHDPISVEHRRLTTIAESEAERISSGDFETDPAYMEDDEYAELQEKLQRGIAIKETKALWESIYGSKPRYDLPDTRYRGHPTGERGGFYQNFQRINGSTKDVGWVETVLRMILALIVFMAGCAFMMWAFYKTLFSHGKFLLGMPVALAIMGLGVFVFFAIPISRPLSSSSRFWLDRAYRQTHDPLPPFLVSSDKKIL